MLVRAAVCIVHDVCALLLGFFVGILGLGFYARAQVMCVACLLARHLVAVMQGECACDHQFGRICHQAAANPNSTCLAWFQHSRTPIKVCETVTPSFLSNVRRFYRSLFGASMTDTTTCVGLMWQQHHQSFSKATPCLRTTAYCNRTPHCSNSCAMAAIQMQQPMMSIQILQHLMPAIQMHQHLIP